MTRTLPLPKDFRSLSQRIGSDPLLVQGAGGNTSFKADGAMWIKASGTLLANAVDQDIFVAVDTTKALAELDGVGDGSCRSALIDPHAGLRPSIETTFHAMFPETFVFHFHSIATICHAISVEGRVSLQDKLAGLDWVSAPYRKPGIPLSRAIRNAIDGRKVQVVVLENHGVIVVGDSIEEVAALIEEVESRLQLTELKHARKESDPLQTEGWNLLPDLDALANVPLFLERATAGTYYPDHVVFLGPALPSIERSAFQQLSPDEFPVPALLVPGSGVYLKSDASAAHHAMLSCLHNVLSRIPDDWNLVPIGQDAETELLNWDAEKYRQMLAKKNA